MSNRARVSIVIGIVTIVVFCATTRALPPNGEPDANPDPELERQTFKLADGWEINLFASDPMLEKPIQMNWDAQGRLWCATSETYPQVKPGQVPNDKIYILEDTKGQGKADKATVFADGLFIPTAVIPGDGGVYVTNSTEILHLSDSKGTGKADTRRVVLAGFGTEDTHHIVHTLRWGPDGKLYFLQSIYIHSHLETPRGVRHLLGSGVWRFDTRTLDLGVYSRGLVNPWGIVWDPWGQTFETDGAGGEGINYAFPGIGFTSAVGLEKIMPGLNPGSPKYCGEEILGGRTIPDEYQGDILTNDFRANRVVRFKLSENGAGFTAKLMPDFITSTDRAFRPVDIKMGPDGAIYIADWYNPIINHGEVDFRDPRRDHTHGRIWRVTHKGSPTLDRPRIVGASIDDLLALLKAPEEYTRSQAKLALREREPKQVMAAVSAWVRKIRGKGPESDHERLEALWVCENVNVVDPGLLDRVLKSDEPRARAAAVRVVGHWADQLDNPDALLEPMLSDEFPRVRLEAVRALAAIPQPRSVVLATRVLDKPMDPFIEYALWLTCNELSGVWMPAFEAGRLTDWGKAEHLNFALRAVKSPAALKTLVQQLKSGKVPAGSQSGMIDLIANIGGVEEANALFDLALHHEMKDKGANAKLLAALLHLSKQQVKPSENLESLKPLLSDSDEAVRAGALRLAGAWKLEEMRPQITSAAESHKSSAIIRRAAIDGLASLGGGPSAEALRKLSGGANPRDTRAMAVSGLAVLDLKEAARQAADAIRGGAEPGEFVAAFLNREGGPDALADELKTSKIPTDAARLALRYLRGTGAPAPTLTEVLTAAAGMTGAPVQLSAAQMNQMMQEVVAKGDAANGERVFRRSDTACYQCHSIAGAGGWLAPDLSSVGASSPLDYLIDSVLDPNKAVKDGYTGYTIITNSGETYSGIKVSQDDKNLVLRDTAHERLAIPINQVKAQKQVGSLMPNGLADYMTHQELLDVVKFLSQLGKPGPFGPATAQYVRRWRVMQPVPDALAVTDPPVSEIDRQTWGPAYSLVSGALPMDVLGEKGKPVGYVRGEINVTAPGEIRLVVNSASGISAWVDDHPITVQQDLTLDLARGTHVLTFRIDRQSRGEEGLRVEVADAPGSSAHAQPVGGP